MFLPSFLYTCPKNMNHVAISSTLRLPYFHTPVYFTTKLYCCTVVHTKYVPKMVLHCGNMLSPRQDHSRPLRPSYKARMLLRQNGVPIKPLATTLAIYSRSSGIWPLRRSGSRCRTLGTSSTWKANEQCHSEKLEA